MYPANQFVKQPFLYIHLSAFAYLRANNIENILDFARCEKYLLPMGLPTIGGFLHQMENTKEIIYSNMCYIGFRIKKICYLYNTFSLIYLHHSIG